MGTTSLPIEKIRVDGGTQIRTEIDSGVIQSYQDAMLAGASLPGVSVYYDGTDYWLADGFHRLAAAKLLDRDRIHVLVTPGTRRDAILFACGANATHGLRRTNEDKRRAVMTLLNDAEWSRQSDRWVAEKCGVSNHLVATIRSEVGTVPTSKSEPTTRTGKDGKQYLARKRKTEDHADPTPAQSRIPSAPPVPMPHNRRSFDELANMAGPEPCGSLAADCEEEPAEESVFDNQWANEVTDGFFKANMDTRKYLLIKLQSAAQAFGITLRVEE